MRTIETRAGRVAYSELGSGPTVLLLHATLHDRHDFDPILEALARRYRTIAVDWPGHGDSDPVDASIEPSAPLFADVLEDVVDGLGLSQFVLIGNSVGGFAAARLAINRPQSVAGLVLVNTGGFVPLSPADPHVLPRPWYAGCVPPGRSPVGPRVHEGEDRQRPPDRQARDCDSADDRGHPHRHGAMAELPHARTRPARPCR